jgi:hypothetical protein
LTITANDIMDVTRKATGKWTKQRKAEIRGSRSRGSREYVYSDRVCFTHVVDEILPAAYAHASGGGRYSVPKRNLFYACREAFRLETGKPLDWNYFSGNLLVKYRNRHPQTVAGWKITADPRGNLTLPNTGHDTRIPCGTVHIDNHLADAARPCEPFADLEDVEAPIEWPSLAGGQRYQAVLYIEKEGFEPMLEEARIAERYDLAILSCKGMSVVSARKFVDHVCYKGSGVPLLTVTDLDKSGFEIDQRLVSVSDAAIEDDLVTYEFRNEIDHIRLGLTLVDAEAYGLKGESCPFKGYFESDSPATEAEKAYLKSGRRIELNEFTAPQFIEWLEAKLIENGFHERLIPADDVLANAWKRAVAVAQINRAVEKARERAIADAKAATIPDGLRETLKEAIQEHGEAWDRALYEMARRQLPDDGEDD